MQREVAEIIGRLNVQLLVIDVEKPAKRAHSEHEEAGAEQPEPDLSVALGSRS
jgi:hypothetical protein